MLLIRTNSAEGVKQRKLPSYSWLKHAKLHIVIYYTTYGDQRPFICDAQIDIFTSYLSFAILHIHHGQQTDMLYALSSEEEIESNKEAVMLL